MMKTFVHRFLTVSVAACAALYAAGHANKSSEQAQHIPAVAAFEQGSRGGDLSWARSSTPELNTSHAAGSVTTNPTSTRAEKITKEGKVAFDPLDPLGPSRLGAVWHDGARASARRTSVPAAPHGHMPARAASHSGVRGHSANHSGTSTHSANHSGVGGHSGASSHSATRASAHTADAHDSVPAVAQGAVPIGQFTLTAYALTEQCTGKLPGQPGFGITATGTHASVGRTIAVDPSVIPFGTKVYIEGIGWRMAEDAGGAIRGKRIDLLLPSNQAAFKFGVKRHITVYAMFK